MSKKGKSVKASFKFGGLNQYGAVRYCEKVITKSKFLKKFEEEAKLLQNANLKVRRSNQN